MNGKCVEYISQGSQIDKPWSKLTKLKDFNQTTPNFTFHGPPKSNALK